MRPIDFARLKQLVPMHQVLDLISWRPLRRENDELRGPCPVHLSTSPKSRCFAVKGNSWYCHGRCRHGGDQVRLYAEVRGLLVYDAAVELCGELKIAVPYLALRR